MIEFRPLKRLRRPYHLIGANVFQFKTPLQRWDSLRNELVKFVHSDGSFGYSWKSLADKIGINVKTLRVGIYAGKTLHPADETVQKLSKFLGYNNNILSN